MQGWLQDMLSKRAWDSEPTKSLGGDMTPLPYPTAYACMAARLRQHINKSNPGSRRNPRYAMYVVSRLQNRATHTI